MLVPPSMNFASALARDSKLERALVMAFALGEVLVEAGERVGLPGLMRPTGSRAVIDRMAEALIHDPFARPSLPIGFAPREVGATTAKDMARITRLNAEANFGVMLAASKQRGDRALFDVGVMAVLGDGNREKENRERRRVKAIADDRAEERWAARNESG